LNRDLNRQSDDEELFSHVQRVFKSFDSNECGFVLEDQLPALLTRLSVPFASNATDIRRFSDLIQLDGGIILWSTFWENISKILTGISSLDSLLLVAKNESVVVVDSSSTSIQSTQIRQRSDSEIARELQANFDQNPDYEDHIPPVAVVPSVASPQAQQNQVSTSNRPRSDSEIARQMQEEWNQDDTMPSSSSSVTVQSIDESSVSVLPASGTKRHRSDSIATKDDENFVCYHYNGFDLTSRAQPSPDTSSNRSQNLTKFKLYRR
jgi:hypothetical protein